MADDNAPKREVGAKWEGDELVTYDLTALRRNYAASDEEWLPDSD